MCITRSRAAHVEPITIEKYPTLKMREMISEDVIKTMSKLSQNIWLHQNKDDVARQRSYNNRLPKVVAVIKDPGGDRL